MSAGSQPVSIVVCPVPQGAEHDRERVNPAIMKLCPGFHNAFAFNQTIVYSAAVRILVSRKSHFSNFCKGQPLKRSCAVWWKKLHMLSEVWCNPERAPACCRWWRRDLLTQCRCKAKRPRQQKTKTIKQQETVNSCTQNTLEFKIDIAVTICTCQTKINGTLHISRDR